MKLVKILVLAFLSVLAATIIVAVLQIAPLVRANPNHCPDGHTCWCGINKAGKIQLMVDEAKANGWTEVDMALCVPPDPIVLASSTNPPFQPVITWTPKPKPPKLTDTPVPLVLPTRLSMPTMAVGIGSC